MEKELGRDHMLRRFADPIAPSQSVTHFDDAVHGKLKSPLPGLSQFETESNLGRLQALPPELLLSIAQLFDVETAVTFSHVNRGARILLESVSAWRTVRQHARDCVLIIIRMHLGTHVRMTEIASALTAPSRCRVCWKPTSFISLPSLARCCLACSRSINGPWVTSAQAAGKGEFSGYQQYRPIPGRHAGTHDAGMSPISSLRGTEDDCVKEPLGPASADPSLKIPAGFFATCSLPVVDPTSGLARRRYWCRGCTRTFGGTMDHPILQKAHIEYSEDQMWEHLATCAKLKARVLAYGRVLQHPNQLL